MTLGYYIEQDGIIGLAIKTPSDDLLFNKTSNSYVDDDSNVNYEVRNSDKGLAVVGSYTLTKLGGNKS